MGRPYYLQKRNTSSRTLLRYYLDKKSKKVGDARKELRYRFDYLDWTVQKRILTAFLASGKTDRAWAYVKLLRYWDNCFVPVVETLWNKYHEHKCSWPIIRHFPEQFVIENMELLSVDNNYYFICKRLGAHSDFFIDKTKLTQLEYLSVLSSVGRTIDKEEALEMLYELIGNHCSKGLIVIEIGYPTYIIRNIGFNPMDIRDVRRAIYYLKKMGNKEAVDIFTEWCNNIAKKIKESTEFRELSSLSIPDEEYVSRLSDIAIIYMYLALPLSIMSKIKKY